MCKFYFIRTSSSKFTTSQESKISSVTNMIEFQNWLLYFGFSCSNSSLSTINSHTDSLNYRELNYFELDITSGQVENREQAQNLNSHRENLPILMLLKLLQKFQMQRLIISTIITILTLFEILTSLLFAILIYICV